MEFYANLIDFYRFQTVSKILWFSGRLFRKKLGKTLQGISDLMGGVINPTLTLLGVLTTFIQWEFQDPKLEVPTLYKAYVRPM